MDMPQADKELLAVAFESCANIFRRGVSVEPMYRIVLLVEDMAVKYAQSIDR